MDLAAAFSTHWRENPLMILAKAMMAMALPKTWTPALECFAVNLRNRSKWTFIFFLPDIFLHNRGHSLDVQHLTARNVKHQITMLLVNVCLGRKTVAWDRVLQHGKVRLRFQYFNEVAVHLHVVRHGGLDGNHHEEIRGGSKNRQEY